MRHGLARLLYRIAVRLDPAVEPTVELHYQFGDRSREDIAADTRRSLAHIRRHYGRV